VDNERAPSWGNGRECNLGWEVSTCIGNLDSNMQAPPPDTKHEGILSTHQLEELAPDDRHVLFHRKRHTKNVEASGKIKMKRRENYRYLPEASRREGPENKRTRDKREETGIVRWG